MDLDVDIKREPLISEQQKHRGENLKWYTDQASVTPKT